MTSMRPFPTKFSAISKAKVTKLRLLLDTHIFLWILLYPERLSPTWTASITEADLAYVSTASIWEISIKSKIGKLTLPGSVTEAVEESGFLPLPIMANHAELAGALPLHHRDPFDRMLIAQAKIEDLVLVTSDPRMARYDVQILPAS